MKKRLCFLVCNAHLDPVWLWRWEEGPAESFVSVDAGNVLLAALKKEEQGDGLILRFWETGGRPTTFRFEVQQRVFNATINR